MLIRGWAIVINQVPILEDHSGALIKAENDLGDVAEMFQGVKASLQIEGDEDAFMALENSFVPITEDINTGPEFGEAVRHLIGAHKPDLVWLDPLLSFYWR